MSSFKKIMSSLDELGELLANGMNVKANIIPVIDTDSEEFLLHEDVADDEMPVLPLMDQVLLPGVLIPIAARRDKSRRLLSDVKSPNQHILVFPQKNDNDNPDENDLYPVGVVAKVLKVFDFHDDTTVAILQGIVRCDSLVVMRRSPYMSGVVNLAPESDEGMDTPAFRRRMKLLRKSYSEIMRSRLQDEDISTMLKGIGSDKIFINFASTHIDVENDQKYELLACSSYVARAEKLLEQLGTLRGLDELRREIDNKTQELIGKQQREYYLRHQMDVIQKELGEEDSYANTAQNDMAELRRRADTEHMSKELADTFEANIKKLSHIHPASPDYATLYTYLETLTSLPLTFRSYGQSSVEQVRQVLDQDHFGIQKVKDRVVEYLAVLLRQERHQLSPKAQVLCLVGPPGTGKTSICRSIASALDRPYCRMALGGLHDEAEIRGHRRTYIGSMPGRIMQEVIKSKVTNPVFVLDEIDKVQSNNIQGDPASALLEVLDPEQNCHFHDNYLDVDYDLSRVLFIATANSLAGIHPALLDRMEVIDFSGYVIEEKTEIAMRHLLPRIMKDCVVDRRKLKFTPEVIHQVVSDYTREAGVRQLQKQLSKLVRHRVVLADSGQRMPARISADEVRQVLGLPIHNSERARREACEGVVTGLAWTPVGGEILFIESSLSQGKGTITMTGNLGDVMKESATLAFEYIKSNAASFGIDPAVLAASNVHIHVPEGATPKDGPSAGITMFVSMVSSFTHRRVLPTVAMTGEITLRGDVTPVGGIREKLLAARRAGITDIIVCHDNRRDVEDIEPDYLSGLTFHYIGHMAEALPLALEPQRKPSGRKPKAARRK